MSSTVCLEHPKTGKTIQLINKTIVRGSTIEVGGTNIAELVITGNYGALISEHMHPDGLMFLYGKTGEECIPILKAAVNRLGTNIDLDYWKATNGNVGMTLMTLLMFASTRPDGIFKIY